MRVRAVDSDGPAQLHIVYVVTAASTADVLLRGQLRRLRSTAHRVTLIVSPSDRLDALAERDDIDVVPVQMTRTASPLQDLRSLARMTGALRALRPAVLNYGTPKAALLAGLAGWLLRVPHRVYVVRGLRLEGARGSQRLVLRLLEALTLLTATEVWFVSPSLQRRAESLRLLPRGRGRVLGCGSSNGVDVEQFHPGPDRAAGLWGDEAPAGPVVGFVGRLTRDKGVSELWGAVQEVRSVLPGTRLLLVGDFEEGDPVPARVVREIRGDPLTVVTGWTAHTAEHYRAMDVLALPTFREGFPNVVLEASASGLPVVTTTATGAVDSVVHGVTGLLVPVGDAGALAQALLTVLLDPVRGRDMGRAGRARVVEHFRNEEVWARVEHEYAQMGSSLAGPRRTVAAVSPAVTGPPQQQPPSR